MPQQTEIAQLSDNFLKIIDSKNRRYRGITYRNVFVGSEAVDAMLDAGMASTRAEAVTIARRLERELRLFSHVSGHHLFQDDAYFYRISEKDTLALSSLHYTPEELFEKAQQFRQLAIVKDRKYRFKKYKKCFVGSEIIDAMVYNGLVQSRQEGVLLGRALEQHLNWFHHVTGDHNFRDDHLFYRFNLFYSSDVAADMVSVAKSDAMSLYSYYTPSKPVASSAASTTSSLSSSWTTKSPNSAQRSKQTQKKMLQKIHENLKANDYSETTLANTRLVMSELKHKLDKMYTGHQNAIETRAGSENYKPPAPLSDIVFRPPPQPQPEEPEMPDIYIPPTPTKKPSMVREDSYEYDEFTILEGDTEETSDDESLYVEETVADDQDAYKFETRLSWLSSSGISAITT